jgi:two-component system, OmpR family, copper resistance phosphate regulon response regulator CusR
MSRNHSPSRQHQPTMHRILIVEDEARVSAFLEKGLRKHGFMTMVAKDGNQAIQITQNENVQLLLLDLGLPIKDGYSVLCELREQGNILPIIVITAQDNERSKATALACGASDFVAKPFHFYQLLEKVRSYLDPMS